MKKPKLSKRGAAFYKATIDQFSLSESELQLLAEACRLMDEIEILTSLLEADGLTFVSSTGVVRSNPALGEARSHRIALARILAQLSLPDESGDVLATARQVRSSQASAKRWAKAV
jgi:hypothetical protein